MRLDDRSGRPPTLGRAGPGPAPEHPLATAAAIDGAARTPWYRSRRVAARVGVGVCLLLALWAGLWVRAMAWRVTSTIRYGPDLNSAYHWGTRAHEWGGFLRVYDEERIRNPRQNLLDYPPLRLLVVTWWAEGLRHRRPNFDGRTWSRQVVKPLLRVNLAAELASAVGLFLLVRTWLGRRALAPDPGRPPPAVARGGFAAPIRRLLGDAALDVGTVRGLTVALLFWFNPAVIIDAHVFPQWDMWLMPSFVFGVLLATLGWWFWAGVLVAIGSMLKGQLLLVAGLFILWPLFARQWSAPLRWLAGFASAAAVIVAPWLVSSRGAALWVAAVLLALGAARLWTEGRAGNGRVVGALALLLGSALAPWLLVPDRPGRGLGLVFAGLLLAAARLVPAGQTRYLAAFALAAAVGIAGVAFDGSFMWFHMGFRNQAGRSLVFLSDVGTPGRILHDFFAAPADTALVGPWRPGSVVGPPIGKPLTVGHVFVLAYVLTLVLAAWAAARHARRRDPRFLLAIAVPWVTFFTLLPNLRTRYLVWGAGLTATGAVVGWGPLVLHGVITVMACDHVLRTLLPRAVPPFAPKLVAVLNGVHPRGGWLVLACALALLCVALRASPGAAEERDAAAPTPSP